MPGSYLAPVMWQDAPLGYHGTGEFLQKKRISLGFGQEILFEGGRKWCAAQGRPHHLPALVGTQRLEAYLGHVGFLEPRWPIPWSRGHQQHQWYTRKPLYKRCQVCLRGRIDPMQILDLNHARLLLTPVEEQLMQGLEGAFLQALRA